MRVTSELVERLGAVDAVVERELRERMRSRAGAGVTLYLAIILLVAWLMYSTTDGTELDPTSLGRLMFESILLTQLFVVLFIVPAAVSGSLAGERERGTLIPLQLTLIRPWRIVLGKAIAGVAFLALLLVASLPLVMISYLLGGISFGQVVGGTLAVGFVGAVLACTTVACSSRARRTQTATVQAYLVVLLLLVAPVIGSALWAIANPNDPSPPAVMIVWEPPLFVAAVVGGEQDGFGGLATGPLTSLATGVDDAMAAEGIVDRRPDVVLQDGRWEPPRADPSNGRTMFAVLSGLALGLLAVLSLLSATRSIRTPKQTDR